MKKLFAALLGAMLLFNIALAEEWDSPALRNPKERYEYYFDETDGSEQLLFAMLDVVNDEESTVAEYGALKVVVSNVDASGRKQSSTYTYVQECEFGPMLVNAATPEPSLGAVYTVGTHNYLMFLGKLTESYETGTKEDFDWYWSSFHFPFGSLELLHCMRQDEAGYSYFLVKSDDSMSFEFVTDGSMEIMEIRTYEAEDGELVLKNIVNFEPCAAVEIPEDALEAMAKDFAN